MTVGGALYVGGLGSNPTVTITSSGDTWTTDTYYIQIANYSRAVFLAHGKAASGGSKTITATFSVSFGGGASEGIFVQELSHLNCTLDKAITANSAGSLNSGTTSFTSGTMTTTSDAVDMLVANCGAGASETWTAGGVQDSGVGYAIDATNGVDTASSPAAIEYQAVSATGAFAGLMTISSATSGPCVVVALN
jgi:hypothetical protein